MTQAEEGQPVSRPASAERRRRKYVPPTLEKLGTIRELTRGLGMNNNFDGSNPPGQNKSRL
ncbi:MAG TPA: lasso RiPP family leader peptide-containing protein [Thermoanaerobaculia bacterium]|jgi:hypothetical protein|nr:lasso RiPP family leader peptide-containing protein [Thermoanaerobaculia bacterium]